MRPELPESMVPDPSVYDDDDELNDASLADAQSLADRIDVSPEDVLSLVDEDNVPGVMVHVSMLRGGREGVKGSLTAYSGNRERVWLWW